MKKLLNTPYWDKGKFWRIVMKLTMVKLVLMFSLLNTYASVYSQAKISDLSLNKTELSEALKSIEKLSDYTFIFNYNDVLGHTVTAHLKDMTIEECMNNILKDKPFTYKVDGDIVIVSFKKLTAQQIKQKTIKGIVIDKAGNPLPGVTVLLKGTNMGVATDINGKFKLDVAENEIIVLVFSFVGMETKEVVVKDDKDLKILMEEAVGELDEVVITGYQVIDRRKLTSAVTSVKGEELMMPGATTIDQMLEGRIPDMIVMTNSGEVGVVPKIRIRGTSTLIGNREPLWVIDGIIVSDPVQISPDELNDPDYINRIGNAISGLNPQDIERIDVLKDAAATALYGTKAANGVIVISTKKGHVGKPVITFSNTNTYKLRPRYSDKKINLMTGKERLSFSQELFNRNYAYPNTVSWVGYEGLLKSLYSGEMGYDEFNAKVSQLKETNTDWFSELSEDSFSSENTVSVTGGTDNIRYYSSFGYLNDNDVIKDNSNNRYTAILNLDVKFSPVFSTSFSFNANKEKRNYYQSEISPIDYAYNTSRLISPDDYYLIQQGIGSYKFNIKNELDNSGCKQNSKGTTYRINMKYSPLEWLSFNGILSYTQSDTDIESYWGESTFHVATLRKAELGEKIDGDASVFPFGGEYKLQQSGSKSYTVRLQSNVNKYWGEIAQHNINASLGFEISSKRYKGYENITRGYYPERGKQFAIVSPELYPAYANWLSSNVPVIIDNMSNIVSFYATATYSYKNLFNVNANMRYDGSNKFGNRSNDNILPVWSASFSYNLNEHIKEITNIFNDIMFKASYGYQGNMLTGQSPVMIISKEPYDTHYGKYISKISVYPNENLKWERTGSSNVGLEFSMLDRRLMVSSSYYYKKTNDAFMDK
ncbi:MAG: SusC/RagA family TonB-linked outer membrane protein, partial [Bacteroidales bacterium]